MHTEDCTAANDGSRESTVTIDVTGAALPAATMTMTEIVATASQLLKTSFPKLRRREKSVWPCLKWAKTLRTRSGDGWFIIEA